MQLGFGGSGSDGTPGDEVRDELRRDGIEEFGSDGHAHRGDVPHEFSSESETLVNLERVVDIRVAREKGMSDRRRRRRYASTTLRLDDSLDETLPSDSRPGLFKVDPHDDLEVGPPAISDLSPQLGRVLSGLIRIVDRAGSDDDEQSVVFTVDDLGGGGSSLLDGLVGFGRGRDIVTQERGGDQRVVLRGVETDGSANWTIVVKRNLVRVKWEQDVWLTPAILASSIPVETWLLTATAMLCFLCAIIFTSLCCCSLI